MSLAPGVWGVVATPFQGPDLTIDFASLRRLVTHYDSLGATGLTVLGVFGEAAQLTGDERQQVLHAVSDAVDLPIVVGVTALGTHTAIDEVRNAQEQLGDRMAAAMVQVNFSDATSLRRHLTAIRDEAGVDIVVQDYPVASGVQIPAQALVSAVHSLPFVVAVKAEAPPTAVNVAALTSNIDVPVFGGLGGIGLLDELAAGAAGAMTGFSFPEGLVDCVRAWRDGGFEAARAAFVPYLPLVNFEQQPRFALAIRKECLRQRGFFTDSAVRPPAAPLPPALGPQLRRHLEALLTAVDAEQGKISESLG